MKDQLGTIELDLDWLRRVLTWVIGLMVALHYLAIPVLVGQQSAAVGRVVSILSLDEERGVGTLIEVVLMSACALLCWVHARQGPDWSRRRWGFLAVALGFVALDEVATIHEGLDQVLFDLTDGDSPLTFLWIIPYGLAAAAIGAAYLPFLRRLPRAVSRRLFLGGVLYVAGAVGLEVVGSMAFDRYGLASAPFLAASGVEEGLEMVGTALALLGLLHVFAGEPRTVRVVGSTVAGSGSSGADHLC